MYGGMVEAFASSVYHAVYSGAFDRVEDRWLPKERRDAGEKPEQYLRRVRPDELMAVAFVQGWGDTAMGFDAHSSIAGQAMTSALTVIVHNHTRALVYFAGSFAYAVERDGMKALLDDARFESVEGQRKAMSRYGARLTPTASQEPAP